MRRRRGERGRVTEGTELGGRSLTEDREQSARFEAELAFTYVCTVSVQYWWNGLARRYHSGAGK